MSEYRTEGPEGRYAHTRENYEKGLILFENVDRASTLASFKGFAGQSGGVLAIEVAVGRPSREVTYSVEMNGMTGDSVLRGGVDFGGHIWPISAFGVGQRPGDTLESLKSRFLYEKAFQTRGAGHDRELVAPGEHQRKINSLAWATLAAEMGQVKLPEPGVARSFQSGTLPLTANVEAQTVKEGELSSIPEHVMNVAGVYSTLRDDIYSGTHTVPDFQYATHLIRLVEDLALSSEDGCRKSASAWPVA
jgi:hypothetical protein